MNILFVCPESADKSRTENCPPYGLACLTAYLRKHNPYVKIKVIDYNDKITHNHEENFGYYDLIGFGFITANSKWVYEMTKQIKAKNSHVVIVHGGIHPTIKPDDSLLSGADIVMDGESEVSFSELLDVIDKYKEDFKKELDKIAGIIYRIQNKNYHTSKREFIKNLDEIPFPDWSEYNFKAYNHSLHDNKGFAFPIMGSRGCAFACEFCCSPFIWKKKIRYRSPENVLEEIKYNIKKFNINRFHFYDDDFLSNIRFVERFCELIINENISIEYVILARSDSVIRQKDSLDLLRRSGCKGIEVGVENPDSSILEKMKKNITVDQILTTADLLKKNEIKMICLLMFCYPGETIESIYCMNEFINHLLGNPKKLVHGQYLIPFPGTPLAHSCVEEGVVIEDDTSHFMPTNVVYIPNSILNQHPIKKQKPDQHQLSEMTASYMAAARKFGFKQTQLMIMELFESLDGSLTIGEIVEVYITKKNFERKFAYQFIYVFINFLAQFGVIKDSGKRT